MPELTTPNVLGPITQTPDELTAARNFLADRPVQIGSTPVGPDTSPSVVDVVKSAFLRENLVTQALVNGGVSPEDDTANWNPNWSPYDYFTRNKEEYMDIQPYLLNGRYDRVYSEAGFKRLTNAIRESRKNEETIAAGGWTGVGATMLAGLLDVTSLIPMAGPLKWATTGTRAASAVKTAGVLASVTAANEAGLHYFDPARTKEESFMAVGLTSVLGAGLGSLAHRLPDSLHPRNPRNPMNVDANQGIEELVDIRPGQSVPEGVRTTAAEAQEMSRAVNDSVGAMRARASDSTELAMSEGVRGALMKAVNWTANRFTPMARSYGWLPRAREAMQKMADNGGVYTKGMLRGETIGGVMEDRMMAHRANVEDTLETLRRTYVRLNMALGESKAGAVLGDAVGEVVGRNINRIPREVYWGMVSRRLLRDKHLADGFTEASSLYETRLKEAVRDLGLDEGAVKTFAAHVEEAAAYVRKSFSELADTVVRSGVMDPDLKLGDGYGLPQVWKKGQIDADPQGFVRLMRELWVDNPPDEWLAQNGYTQALADKGVTSWKELPAKDRDEILEAWQGDKEAAILDAALARFEESARKLQKAEAELDVVDHGLKAAQKDNQSAKARFVRQEARRMEADYIGKKLAVAHARIERAAERIRKVIDDGVDHEAVLADVKSRLEATGPALDDVLEEALARKGASNQAKDLVRKLQSDLREDRAPLKKNGQDLPAEELMARRAEIEEATKQWQEAIALRKEAEAELKDIAGRQRSLQAFYEKTARALEDHLDDVRSQKYLDGLERSVELAGERAAAMREKSAQLDLVRKQLADELKLIRQGRKVTNDEVRQARKAFNSAKRIRARLLKATGLNEYLDNLVTALRDGEKAPNGILVEEAALSSGRLKARKIKLSPELQEKLEKAGYLESDLGLMLKKSWRELGAMDAAQKTFGTTKIDDILNDIRSEYDDAAQAARDAGDTELAAALTRQRREAEQDLTTVWNRVTGRTYLGGDGPEILVQGSRMLRSASYLGIAGGITLSAMGDLGTALLATRGFFPGLVKHWGSYRKLIEGAKKSPESARQLRALLSSLETSGHVTMSGHMEVANGLDDIGVMTGTVAESMRRINNKLSQVGDKVNILSGLRLVSDTIRRTAALVQMDNLVRWVGDYSKLTPQLRAELAASGVGEAEASRLAYFFDKHGFDEIDGNLKIPRIDKWAQEEDGDLMRDVFNAVLLKAQRRSSIAAGAGTLPGMMDNWVGAMLLQFQSYAFQFTTNVLLGGTQRVLTVGDTRPLVALGMVLLGAGLTSEIRAAMRGEDTATWDNNKWAWEVINRSGLFGMYGPYADAAIKLVGQPVNQALGVDLFQVSSKYRGNDWLNSLLGPWSGVIKTTSGATSDLVRGEYSAAFDKAYRLIPLHQMHQGLTALGQALGDD